MTIVGTRVMNQPLVLMNLTDVASPSSPAKMGTAFCICSVAMGKMIVETIRMRIKKCAKHLVSILKEE